MGTLNTTTAEINRSMDFVHELRQSNTPSVINASIERVRDNEHTLIARDVFNTPIVFVGDSITAGSSGFSRICGYMMEAGQTVRGQVGYNQGIGGNTIQQVIDRIPTISDAMSADCVIDMMIGTNDITLQTGNADYFKHKIIEAVNLFFDYGAGMIILHPIPLPSHRDNGEITFDAWKEQRLLFNAALLDIKMDNVIVETHSLNLVMTDNDYTDGTHLTLNGAIKLGKAQAKILSVNMKKARRGLLVDNLLTNPALDGTSGSLVGSGNPTGVIADNWTGASPHAAGAVFSKTLGAIHEGSEAITITLPEEDLGSSDSVLQIRQNVNFPATSVGDAFYAIADYKVENGHKGVENIDCEFGNNMASTERARRGGVITDDAELSGSLCTMLVSEILPGTTSFTFAITVRLKGLSSIVIHVDKPVIRKL